MIRPVRSSPCATARALSCARVPRLAHARDEEDLVVHREAEEHREQEDRDPALDLRELVEAEQRPCRRPNRKTTTSSAVGRGDREQVQQHRLQRQEQRAERAHQQQVGEHEHRRATSHGKCAYARSRKSTPCGGPPPAQHARAGREARGRDQLARAAAATKSCACSDAVLVPAGDDHLRVAPGRVDEAAARRVVGGRDLGVAPRARATSRRDRGLRRPARATAARPARCRRAPAPARSRPARRRRASTSKPLHRLRVLRDAGGRARASAGARRPGSPPRRAAPRPRQVAATAAA